MSFPLILRTGTEGTSTGEYFPVSINVSSFHDSHTSAGGSILRQLWTVPATEIWYVTAFIAKNNTAQRSEINIAVYDGTDWICLAGKNAPAQYETVALQTPILVKGGYVLGSWFRNTTVNDVLQTDILYCNIRAAVP